MNTVKNILYVTTILLSALFGAYIFRQFLSRDRTDWKSVSDFSHLPGAGFMCFHWVGGILVLAFGPLQVSHAVRARWPSIHRWSGRVYTLGCVSSVIGGVVFVVETGTVGGSVMDTCFVVYGVLFLACCVCADSCAMRRNFDLHREFAYRTFALGIGSLLYRIYTLPLWFMGDKITEEQNMLWLNVAGWFMFVPNIVIVEIFLWTQRRHVRKIILDETTGLLN